MARSSAVKREVPAKRTVPGKAKADRPSKLRPEIVTALAELDQIVHPPAVVDPWENARKAHDLLLTGKGWEQVASALRYPSVAQCTLEVRGYLAYVHTMTGDEEREVAKRIQLDRLEVLYESWLEEGKQKADAAAVLLRILEREARLQGLEDNQAAAGTVQTFIITDGADMAAELRAIADAANVGRPGMDDVEDAEIVDETTSSA